MLPFRTVPPASCLPSGALLARPRHPQAPLPPPEPTWAWGTDTLACWPRASASSRSHPLSRAGWAASPQLLLPVQGLHRRLGPRGLGNGAVPPGPLGVSGHELQMKPVCMACPLFHLAAWMQAWCPVCGGGGSRWVLCWERGRGPEAICRDDQVTRGRR